MRVQVVDPSAYTPPYDHALCSALAREGVDVELVTSHFPYGELPAPDGYRVRELFYRRAFGAPGSRTRSASKLLTHVPDMVRLRGVARDAELVHFQWLPVQWLDAHLLPRRPLVLTAHDLLPREPRPGQARAQRRVYDAVDAVVVHSNYGRDALAALGVDPAKLEVIHHGSFQHLGQSANQQLPPELTDSDATVVLFFGLLRPYKGLDVLLDAWRRIEAGELWIVGRPRMALEPLQAKADPRVRFVPRFVSEPELKALFTRADVVVLPYSATDRLDFSGVLATALAFGKAIVLSDVGSFPEVAATGAAKLVPASDPEALATALNDLIDDPEQRQRLQEGARAAANGPYSWSETASRTLALYHRVASR